jgi:hypothetical protein
MDIPVTLDGMLRPDGTLELDQRVPLPAGPVRVTIEVVDTTTTKRDPLEVLQEIWAERQTLGLPARTREEIDAELKAMRDEWEQRQQALDQVREQTGQDRV